MSVLCIITYQIKIVCPLVLFIVNFKVVLKIATIVDGKNKEVPHFVPDLKRYLATTRECIFANSSNNYKPFALL